MNNQEFLTGTELYVIQMKNAGMSFTEIGRNLGLCRGRANAIYHEALHFDSLLNDPFIKLIYRNSPTRHEGNIVLRALQRRGITTIAGLKKLTVNDAKKIRSIGDRTMPILEKAMREISEC